MRELESLARKDSSRTDEPVWDCYVQSSAWVCVEYDWCVQTYNDDLGTVAMLACPVQMCISD